MAYQNQKVKARQVITPNTQTQDLGIVSNVPMGEWNPTTQYQKLNTVRSNGATYQAKKNNQGVEPTVTEGWQEIWQVVAYDGALSPVGNYPGMTVGNATNAQNDGNGENIAEQFAEINEKIPSTASAENQLADKAFVNSSINAMAAFYITYNASGSAFQSREALLGATTFYSGGQSRVPTQNDYAIVSADESQPQGADGKYPTTRYSYQGGTYPNGAWSFQYVVNNTSLTQAQLSAINSGITNALVEQIGTNTSNISQKVDKSGGTMTGALNAPSLKVNGNEVYSPSNPPPASTFDPDDTYPNMTVGNATNANNAETANSAKSADKLSTTYYIDGVAFNGTKSIGHYGTSATSAGVATKIVTLKGNQTFSLTTEARIIVFFSNKTTVAPSLNVNSTGAIKVKSTNDNGFVTWESNTAVEFVYDGTNWVIVSNQSAMDMSGQAIAVNRGDQRDFVKSWFIGTEDWSRVWASGWHEMGGNVSVGDIKAGGYGTYDVKFYTPLFSKNSYTVQVTANYFYAKTDRAGFEVWVDNMTTTGCRINVYNRNSSNAVSGVYLSWEAKGY